MVRKPFLRVTVLQFLLIVFVDPACCAAFSILFPMAPPLSSPSTPSSSSPISVTAVLNSKNDDDNSSSMESNSKSEVNNTTSTDTTNTNSSNPRTCILQIGVSTGRLCAVANSHLLDPSSSNQDSLVWALRDVLSDLWVASRSLNLDLQVAVRSKMALNNKKYPVELCKGKAGKYTQYSAQTGVTKTNQSTMDQTTTNINSATSGDESSSSSSPSSAAPLSLSEFLAQLPTLAADINDFATARSWAQFHAPRNLVLALMGEFGELAELLQWKGDNNDNTITDMELLDKLSQELADVTIYLLRLTTVCKVVEPLCEAMKE